MSAPFWVDIIGDIVTEVRTDVDKPSGINADAPYYLYGHPLDVIKELTLKDRSVTEKSKKYPLIALLQDFEEGIGEDHRVQSSTSLNVIIALNTKGDYNSEQRYDNSFRNILYPLYDLFVEKLISSGWFLNVSPDLIPHTKIDRLYWGRSGLYGNEGNVFNDRLDAIEIQNLLLDLNLVKRC